MARKVYIEVKYKLVISIDEDTIVDDVVNEMDYEFTIPTDVNATLEDSEFIEFEITDSK